MVQYMPIPKDKTNEMIMRIVSQRVADAAKEEEVMNKDEKRLAVIENLQKAMRADKGSKKVDLTQNPEPEWEDEPQEVKEEEEKK